MSIPELGQPLTIVHQPVRAELPGGELSGIQGALIKCNPCSLAHLVSHTPDGLCLGSHSLGQCGERGGQPTSCQALRRWRLRQKQRRRLVEGAETTLLSFPGGKGKGGGGHTGLDAGLCVLFLKPFPKFHEDLREQLPFPVPHPPSVCSLHQQQTHPLTFHHWTGEQWLLGRRINRV